MLIVQVCDFGYDGDARYRLHDPSRFLGRLPGVTSVDCHFFSRHLPALSELADVLVVQFVNDWDLLELCLRRRAAGRVTVFEANDYFFDLQPWNPIVGHWQDRTVQELYLQFLMLCDGVQTSTDELARRWKQRGAANVAVFPNHFVQVPPLPLRPQRSLTIGWAGSPGHLADWYDVAPLLQNWLDAHPDVHLAVMTNEVAQPFFRLPPERYRFAPFGSLESYLQFLHGVDIGIAPLLPTGYNRCRSDVKFLEYASQGVAGIYADYEPYRATVVPQETGLLYRTHDELVNQLDQLCSDANLRHKIRQLGHEYVCRQRLLADHIAQRLGWYKSLMMSAPTQAPVPPEIAGQALRELGYLQLPLGEAEKTLRDALRAAKTAEATAMLAPLVEKYPRYVAALQNYGKVLNDQRQHHPAIKVLEQARQLRPDSARTLAEIGRAHFRLGDDGRARSAMEEAVCTNPRHLPAWQYLLRMLAVNKSPDGPEFARRALEIFPGCYPLALLGSTTYASAQAPRVLLELLRRYAPTIASIERATALQAFRQAVLNVLAASEAGGDMLEALARACAVFPESGRLAAEYAAALHRAGRAEESHAEYARALSLHRSATVNREEFKPGEAPPLIWQLAEHIRSARAAESAESNQA
jgi:tetratricopeptide (TPR) repeat protein